MNFGIGNVPAECKIVLDLISKILFVKCQRSTNIRKLKANPVEIGSSCRKKILSKPYEKLNRIWIKRISRNYTTRLFRKKLTSVCLKARCWAIYKASQQGISCSEDLLPKKCWISLHSNWYAFKHNKMVTKTQKEGNEWKKRRKLKEAKQENHWTQCVI